MASLTSHLSITASTDGRLDRLLAGQVPAISRARFQRLIADGKAAVDGRTETDANARIKLGSVITVDIPEASPAEPAAEAISLDILYEDSDLLVLNKPAGLVVHPGAGHGAGTLVNALLAHCGASLSGIGGVKRPGIVHRLDKDTSGVMVVAKNDAAHQGLSEQFAAHGRDGRLIRHYLALAWGNFERTAGKVEANLARSPANRLKMTVSHSTRAKTAVTHYEVLKAFNAVSLLRCSLETGRTHQIRVHMAHIGHPLLGDPLYGRGFQSSIQKLNPKAALALKALGRQALHAESLGFDHPLNRRTMFFQSEPPTDMIRLINSLAEITSSR